MRLWGWIGDMPYVICDMVDRGWDGLSHDGVVASSGRCDVTPCPGRRGGGRARIGPTSDRPRRYHRRSSVVIGCHQWLSVLVWPLVVFSYPAWVLSMGYSRFPILCVVTTATTTAILVVRLRVIAHILSSRVWRVHLGHGVFKLSEPTRVLHFHETNESLSYKIALLNRRLRSFAPTY